MRRLDELIALASVASQYGGIYATHMRSEGQAEMEALDEAIRIGREAHLPVEIFHLKVSGKIALGLDAESCGENRSGARDSGVDIAADMYPYLAGATALASCLPPWVADGGTRKLLERLRDPAMRHRESKPEMAADHPGWENLYFDSGGAPGVMISGVVNADLKKYDGKTVAKWRRAKRRIRSMRCLILFLPTKRRPERIYFIANEEDLQYGLKQRWTSIGFDANETSLDGPIYELT